MEIIYLLAGLFIGFIVGFLVVKLRFKSGENIQLEEKNELGRKQAQLEERANNLQSEKERLTCELESAETRNEQQLQRLAKAEVEFLSLIHISEPTRRTP